MKQKIGFIGGLISASVIVAFAVYLVTHNIPQNVVSWIMWAVLDSIILIGCFAAGNKQPWIPAGFVLGACLVTIILLMKGVWRWDTIETISAIGIAIALVCWWKLGAKFAIVASTIATVIAGIPAMHDAWLQPNHASWWLWSGITFGCTFSLYGVKKWSIEDHLFPCSTFVFGVIMTILVLR